LALAAAPAIGSAFFSPHPMMFGEAQVLEIGAGDPCHQRMSVQAGP